VGWKNEKRSEILNEGEGIGGEGSRQEKASSSERNGPDKDNGWRKGQK
jgi:hypothetical protein